MAQIFCVILVSLVVGISSHGYVESPRSRNYRAHEEGREFDQNGLNSKASSSNEYGSGVCGVSQARNYDTFLDEWISEGEYTPGGIIEITSRLTAYHGGHFEIGACAEDEPDQDCFDRNKLLYEGGGHPRDEAYPERAYLGTTSDRGEMYTHRFRLPPVIRGERVLLQWRYFTGNTCQPDGYNDYFRARGWNPGATGTCDKSTYDDTGGTAPERFWNCIEITVRGPNDSSMLELPSGPSTSSSTSEDSITSAIATAVGVATTVSTAIRDNIVQDTVTPGVSSSQADNCLTDTVVCGPGNECPLHSSGERPCCSQFGYCGFSGAHCYECCQSNCKESPNKL